MRHVNRCRVLLGCQTLEPPNIKKAGSSLSWPFRGGPHSLHHLDPAPSLSYTPNSYIVLGRGYMYFPTTLSCRSACRRWR